MVLAWVRRPPRPGGRAPVPRAAGPPSSLTLGAGERYRRLAVELALTMTSANTDESPHSEGRGSIGQAKGTPGAAGGPFSGHPAGDHRRVCRHGAAGGQRGAGGEVRALHQPCHRAQHHGGTGDGRFPGHPQHECGESKHAERSQNNKSAIARPAKKSWYCFVFWPSGSQEPFAKSASNPTIPLRKSMLPWSGNMGLIVSKNM